MLAQPFIDVGAAGFGPEDVVVLVLTGSTVSGLVVGLFTAWLTRRSQREANINAGRSIEVQHGGLLVEVGKATILEREELAHSHQAAADALKTALTTSGSVLLDTIAAMRVELERLREEVRDVPNLRIAVTECRASEHLLKARIRALERQQGMPDVE